MPTNLILFAIKWVSKPVGEAVTWAGKHNPYVRRYIIIPPAQLYNILEVRSKMGMLRMKQPRRVPPLSLPIATELGCNLLSETIVLAITLGLIYFEFSRHKLKSLRSNQEEVDQRRVMFERLENIGANIEEQERDIYSIKADLNGFRK